MLCYNVVILSKDVNSMRKLLKAVICIILIVSTVLLPVAASAKVMRILKVTADNVRMREGYGEDADVLCKLKKGTKLLYRDKNVGGRCKVTTTGNVTGYVYKGYLSSYGTIDGKRLYKTTTKAPIYKRSGDKLRHSGSIASGRFLYVEKTASGWAYVKTTDGRRCYIKTKYIGRAF